MAQRLVSIADQSETALGGPASILTRQRRDHLRLDELLRQLEAARGDAIDTTLTELARWVFPHAYADEAVIWPLARRMLPDGETWTRRVEQNHQRLVEIWQQLDHTPRTSPRHAALLAQVVNLLRDGVRDEEDVVLPALQQKLDPAALRRAGTAWALVRSTAPTRPHPVVAGRPANNLVAVLPLTLVDRARDRLVIRPKRPNERRFGWFGRRAASCDQIDGSPLGC